MNSREIIKKLKAAGFEEVSQKGSHLKLKHPDGRWAVVPRPRKDLPLGTLRNIESTSKVKLK